MTGQRVSEGRVSREPWAGRETCSNGHPWTTRNTRWRIRIDKGERLPTRDCLVCKRVSEGKRRAKLVAERGYR